MASESGWVRSGGPAVRRPGGSGRRGENIAAVGLAVALASGDLLYLHAGGELAQGDAVQEALDALGELAPQVVGQAGVTLLAVGEPTAAGGVHGLVNGVDHPGHRDRLRHLGQQVAAAGAAHALDQAGPAQPSKQLLQVGERYLLAPGDIGDRKSTRLNSSHVRISYAVFC